MLLFLFIAAFVWGVTNPLLKKYSAGLEPTGSFLQDLKHLAQRPMYLLIQVTNLSGSVFFFLGLRTVDVTVGSIIANSLAFVITLLMSVFVLNEGKLKPQTVIGCAVVMVGTALCTVSKTQV